MIATILLPELSTIINQLNRRGAWVLMPVNGRTANEIVKAIESKGEYTHAIIDIEAIQGNIDAALNVVERLRTTTGIDIIVIAQGHDRAGGIFRDIVACGISPDKILTDNDTLLKRQIQQLLPTNAHPAPDAVGHLSREVALDSAASGALNSNDSVKSQLEHRAPPVESSSPIDKAITPPSQIPRDKARQSMIFKPPILSKYQPTVVAVAGAGARIGATTQAMQMLLYLRSQTRKACVVEMHGRQALEQYIELFDPHDVALVDGSHFRIKGCDIFRDPKSFLRAKKDFEYIILDYGRFEDIADETAFLDKDIRVVVCGVKPWESSLIDAIFEIDDGSVQYIFSFAPMTDQKTIREVMRESSEYTYFASYSPDLFSYSGDDELYAKLFHMDGNNNKQAKPGIIDRVKGVFNSEKR